MCRGVKGVRKGETSGASVEVFERCGVWAALSIQRALSRSSEAIEHGGRGVALLRQPLKTSQTTSVHKKSHPDNQCCNQSSPRSTEVTWDLSEGQNKHRELPHRGN